MGELISGNENREMLNLLLAIDRQAILGRLSAGMAHVMNNVLGGVIGQADLLTISRGELNLNKEMEQIIGICEEGVVFTRGISKTISALQESHPLDPSETLTHLIVLLNRVYRRSGIKAILEKSGSIMPVTDGEVFIQAAFHLMLIAYDDVSRDHKLTNDKPMIGIGISSEGSSTTLTVNFITTNSEGNTIPTKNDSSDYHYWILNNIEKSGYGLLKSDTESKVRSIIWPNHKEESLRKD